MRGEVTGGRTQGRYEREGRLPKAHVWGILGSASDIARL